MTSRAGSVVPRQGHCAAGTVGVYVVGELIAKGKRVIAADRFALPTSFDVPEGASLEIRQGDITAQPAERA